MRNANPKAMEPQCGRDVDASGYAVFSDGTRGTAHVQAHRALDEGKPEQGYRLLGGWLASHSGTGSEWVHLHFHMAVFELALGQWDAAYARFLNDILPAAATTGDALTDAPALLWRIALSAQRAVALPWQPLKHRALACVERTRDPFVQIHNLLALAGAGDLTAIEHWLNRDTTRVRMRPENLVEQMAHALHAYASGAFHEAAQRLEHLVPRLSQIGGSAAQLRLFEQLEDRSRQRASGADLTESCARAA